ncbi:MAG: DUF4105 domain-containing protein [Oligoflexales bacterium]|nr:DUF4105 domain-containing protein [Oligoflexales bacterium]
MLKRIFYLFMLGLFSSPSYGLFAPPTDFNDLNVRIITVDTGRDLIASVGHIVLRLTNTKTGDDTSLSWGTYSYPPHWYIDFLSEPIMYWVDEVPVDALLMYYKSEKRSVFQNQLNLSVSQKQKLFQLVTHRLEPEKKYYVYHYIYNNCATIVRDLLNEALHGQLAEHTRNKLANLTLRSHMREIFIDRPWITFFLDLVSNSELERENNAWIEMFHPLMFYDHIQKIPQIDDSGQVIPGTKLFAATEVLIQGDRIPHTSNELFPWIISIGTLFLCFGFFLKYKESKFYPSFLSFYSTLWGLFAGFFGLFFIWGWVFSRQTILHHNVNLWIFWPTDFIFIFFGFRKYLRLFFRLYIQSHLLALFIYLSLYACGVFIQDVSNTAKFLCPLWIFYAFLLQNSLRKSIDETQQGSVNSMSDCPG